MLFLQINRKLRKPITNDNIPREIPIKLMTAELPPPPGLGRGVVIGRLNVGVVVGAGVSVDCTSRGVSVTVIDGIEVSVKLTGVFDNVALGVSEELPEGVIEASGV
jgi:hypothetical protein